jgi:[ribosomal protein S5]-alanine N-acetyltransferase
LVERDRRSDGLSGGNDMNQSSNFSCRIDCKDIVLREYRLTDLDALYRITQEAEILKFLPDWNVSKEQRLEWIENYEIVENNHFLRRVAEKQNIDELRLRLAVLLKETGEFIGWCCTGIKEELQYPNREIMYAISSKHTNKGYATQALRGLTEYLFLNTEVEELNAVALISNVPSNQVIKKAGYSFVQSVELESSLFNQYKAYK